jgi:hypothetical protein
MEPENRNVEMQATVTNDAGLAPKDGAALSYKMPDNFTGVPAEWLESIWPQAEPWIAKACVRNGNKVSSDDIKRFLLNRDMQLWITSKKGEIEAVALTEILTYPKKKYCRLLIGTGRNRQNWQNHITIIEDWAKAQGCDGMESLARNGWERVLKGYSKTHIFLEKGF